MSTSSGPISPVHGTNLITDPIVVSDDEFNALGNKLANELSVSAFNLQPMAFRHYHYEKVWLRIEHIADPTFLSRGIQSKHMKSSSSSIHAHAFDYGNSMITMTWSTESDPTASAKEDAVAERSG